VGQFYPDGIDGWMVKLDAKPRGGIAFDPKFFVERPKTHRPHQVRLDGGDCSSDFLLLSVSRWAEIGGRIHMPRAVGREPAPDLIRGARPE